MCLQVTSKLKKKFFVYLVKNYHKNKSLAKAFC